MNVFLSNFYFSLTLYTYAHLIQKYLPYWSQWCLLYWIEFFMIQEILNIQKPTIRKCSRMKSGKYWTYFSIWKACVSTVRKVLHKENSNLACNQQQCCQSVWKERATPTQFVPTPCLSCVCFCNVNFTVLHFTIHYKTNENIAYSSPFANSPERWRGNHTCQRRHIHVYHSDDTFHRLESWCLPADHTIYISNRQKKGTMKQSVHST